MSAPTPRAGGGAAAAATAAITALTGALLLSQFFRACLAVMAPEISRDLSLTPAGFGALSSAFFLAFGIAQVPVGIAFDRYGVGRPTQLLLATGIGGGLAFALAPGAATAMAGMAALGVACAPVFMGLIHYAGEQLAPAAAARVIGRSNAIGMLGALAAAAPLGWAVHTVGWRGAMLVATAAMAAAWWAVRQRVRDAGHAGAAAESPGAMLASTLGLLRRPALWTLIPMCMALAAGSTFRNAWGGPYLADVFGLGPVARGWAITVVVLAASGMAFWLPVLARRWPLRRVMVVCALACLAAALVQAAWPAAGVVPNVLLMAALGTVATLHPFLMGEGRALVPPAARGRGLGLLNTFVFAGSSLASAGFGWIAQGALAHGWSPEATYRAIFGAAAALIAVGVTVFACARVRSS